MTIISPQEQAVREATARIAARTVAGSSTGVKIAAGAGKILGVCIVYAGFVLLAAVAFIPLLAWRAFAVSKLWEWFVTPHWPNFLPDPSIYVVGSLLLVLSAIMPHGATPKKQNKHSWAVPFVLPAAFLAAGWLWKWWFIG